MAFAMINGARLYYELHGEGHPLILVAGYGCDHRVFLPVLNSLSQSFQVILLDNRGTGETTDQGEELSAEGMAEDVMMLSDHLGLSKPHVMGHSMGGTIAQAIGIYHNDKVGKLALSATAAKWRRAMLWGLKSHWEMRQQNIDFLALIDAVLPWVYGEAFLSDDEQVDAARQLIVEHPYPQSLDDQIRQYQALLTFDSREYLSSIKAPTLILSGEEDLLSLPRDADYLHQHIKGSKRLTLPCAHALHLELPSDFCKALIDFL